MNTLKQITVETYDRRAPELAEYFRGIGTREKHIDYVLDLIGHPKDPRIVEIGCGDGRDAKSIVERTPNYLGFDISTGMIDIAKQYVPDGNFVVADAAGFEFPDDLDAIFAFASLLHLSKDEVRSIFSRAHIALKEGGVFYVSVKHAPAYHARIIRDQFGERLFYFYDEAQLGTLAGDGFEIVSSEIERKGNTNWVEMALRRI
jgi:trans-aconitate methyltransferase